MNTVNFSGRTIDLDQAQVTEVKGMAPERVRELLKGSTLGQQVLFDDQKPPHVAIHVHPPKGENPMAPPGPDGSPLPPGMPPPGGGMPPPPNGPPGAPAAAGSPPPGMFPEMPATNDGPLDPAKSSAIEDFMANLPDGVTLDEIEQWIDSQEGEDEGADDGDADNEDDGSKPAPKFSMTASEMFGGTHRPFDDAAFGAPGSGRHKMGVEGTSAQANVATRRANHATNKALFKNKLDFHKTAAKLHGEAAKAHQDASETMEGDMKTYHDGMVATHKGLAKIHSNKNA